MQERYKYSQSFALGGLLRLLCQQNISGCVFLWGRGHEFLPLTINAKKTAYFLGRQGQEPSEWIKKNAGQKGGGAVNSPSSTVNSPSGSGAANVGGKGTRAQVGGAGAAKTNAVGAAKNSVVGVAKSSVVGVAKSTASPAKMKSKAGGNSNDEYRDTIAEGKYIF